jgi:DNA end-binding protein Ku
LKLAKTLISTATAKKFDFAKYKDVYTEKLTRLIEAKVAGEEIVAAPIHEHPHVINLMDALRQSLADAKKAEPGKRASAAGKPPRKMAASKTPKSTGDRKRKSS